jgi:hypothetical protein
VPATRHEEDLDKWIEMEEQDLSVDKAEDAGGSPTKLGAEVSASPLRIESGALQ